MDDQIDTEIEIVNKLDNQETTIILRQILEVLTEIKAQNVDINRELREIKVRTQELSR